jgi:hypothetical protein
MAKSSLAGKILAIVVPRSISLLGSPPPPEGMYVVIKSALSQSVMFWGKHVTIIPVNCEGLVHYDELIPKNYLQKVFLAG